MSTTPGFGLDRIEDKAINWGGRYRASQDKLVRPLLSRLVPRTLNAFPSLSSDLPTQTLNGAAAGPSTLPYDNNRYSALGAQLTNYGENGYAKRNTVSLYIPTPWAIEFDYWGKDLSLNLRAYDTNSAVWVWVDGKPTTVAPTLTSAGASGTPFTWRLTWGTTNLRRVKVYLISSDYMGFTYTAATDTITPTPKLNPRVAWLTDSWATTPQGGYTQPMVASDLLGWECFLAGQAGSGYVSVPTTGTGRANFTQDARINALAATNPEIVVVAGSLNDDGPLSGIQANASLVYSKLALALPTVPVVVVGPQSSGDSRNYNPIRTQNRDAVQAAAVAAPNVVGFVDPVAGLWITGTGKFGATTGVGPSDVFLDSANAHLTQAGAN